MCFHHYQTARAVERGGVGQDACGVQIALPAANVAVHEYSQADHDGEQHDLDVQERLPPEPLGAFDAELHSRQSAEQYGDGKDDDPAVQHGQSADGGGVGPVAAAQRRLAGDENGQAHKGQNVAISKNGFEQHDGARLWQWARQKLTAGAPARMGGMGTVRSCAVCLFPPLLPQEFLHA